MRIQSDKRILARPSMTLEEHEASAEVIEAAELLAADDSNESDDDDDDDEWGVVSTEDLPHDVHHDYANQLNQTGVLIISGSEEEGDDEQPYVGRIPAEVYQTTADLSLPGTLSMPTEIGTLDDDANEISPRVKERRNSSSNSEVRPQPGFPGQPNRDIIPILIAAAVAVLLLWFGFTFYLVKDRNTWRSSSLNLQQEILQLKELQEKLAKQEKVKPLPPRFSWEDSCPSLLSARDQMTLLDNCWLHAKASVKFGECAAEAKQTFKEWSASLAETADALSKVVWNAAASSWKDPTNTTNSTGHTNGAMFSIPRSAPKDLKGYFDSVTSQVKKAAKNLKSLGPLLDHTASAAMKGLDEAARAAVAAGATAGEAVVAASEMATEMMEDFVEVAREVMDDATRTARLARDR